MPGQEISVRQRNSLAQEHARPPAECPLPTHIKQFARCAIRLRRIEHDASLKTNNGSHQFSKFANGQILASTDILDGTRDTLMQCENTCVRQAVDMQKLPPRRSASQTNT
jgi:hypothetical protein